MNHKDLADRLRRAAHDGTVDFVTIDAIVKELREAADGATKQIALSAPIVEDGNPMGSVVSVKDFGAKGGGGPKAWDRKTGRWRACPPTAAGKVWPRAWESRPMKRWSAPADRKRIGRIAPALG